MRLFRLTVLYMALAFGANGAFADIDAAQGLREGEMKKLVFHPEAKTTPTATFVTEDGGAGTLADYQGKYVLLNFWATWCAPCRKEMPSLNQLEAELGGDSFQVVTLAAGRNPPAAIKAFFEKTGVDLLPQIRDPKGDIAKGMAVFGLPTTVVLNPQGQEIARLRGDADWASDNAKAVLSALIKEHAEAQIASTNDES